MLRLKRELEGDLNRRSKNLGSSKLSESIYGCSEVFLTNRDPLQPPGAKRPTVLNVKMLTAIQKLNLVKSKMNKNLLLLD